MARNKPGTTRKPSKSRQKGTQSGRDSRQFSLGILFGLVILLLFLVLLLFNRNTIETLIRTDRESPADDQGGSLLVQEQPLPDSTEEQVEIQADTPKKDSDSGEGAGNENDSFVVEKSLPQEEAGAEEEGDSGVGEPAAEEERTLRARLFFVQVNDQGYIQLKSVIRPVPYGSTPLTTTLQALLNGPDTREMNRGLLNLIPERTKLLSARVQNGTAYLNFNEAFRFNPMGMDGYEAQIRQLVYTATEFSTIDRVQILLEGQVNDYLGAEGIFIGEPLGRKDLPQQ